MRGIANDDLPTFDVLDDHGACSDDGVFADRDRLTDRQLPFDISTSRAPTRERGCSSPGTNEGEFK